MSTSCENCIHYSTCWARRNLDKLVMEFKFLAYNQREKDNCGTTNTTSDIRAALGGACTARKNESDIS